MNLIIYPYNFDLPLITWNSDILPMSCSYSYLKLVHVQPMMSLVLHSLSLCDHTAHEIRNSFSLRLNKFIKFGLLFPWNHLFHLRNLFPEFSLHLRKNFCFLFANYDSRCRNSCHHCLGLAFWKLWTMACCLCFYLLGSFWNQ